MSFDLGSFDVGNVINQATNALTQGLLANPIKDLNGFINKLSATTSAARAQGNSLAGQNVLGDISSRADPVLSMDWIGLILDPTISISSQLPWYFIDSISTPDFSIGAEAWFTNGKARKFAKTLDLGSVNVKIYSDVNGIGFNFANTWARSTLRQDGYWNLPNRYKKDIQLFLLDATRTIVVDFRLIGCWVTNWSSYQLSEASSIVETNLTLSVDDFYMNYDSDFTAAKSTLDSILTGGLNTQVTNFTNMFSSGVQSAVSSIFGSNSGFNII